LALAGNPLEGEIGWIVSIYAQLLDAALLERRLSGPPARSGDLLAELLRSRAQLGGTLEKSTTANGESKTVAQALADQLAYDVALVEFARGLGVADQPSGFEPPGVARTRLEEALVLQGIPLSSLDGRSP
jgi:hypothetical protein